MKSIKRVTAIVVLCMMLVNIFSVASAQAFADSTDQGQTRMAKLVSGLGIMDYDDDGVWNGDKMVTRAEMALYLCRLKGVGALGSSMRDTDFSDVDSTHWASGYIKTAYDLGITDGYDDGTYRPDENIKYEDAVMMLVCTLGYKPYALEQAAYPTGYLYTATAIDLTKGIKCAIGQDVSRNLMANLIYNCLDIPLMQKVIVGSSASSYYAIFDGEEYTPKKTLLSENLGAVKISGILTDNATTSSSLKENQAKLYIDDNYGSRIVYLNSAYYEGSTITAYCEDADSNELLNKNVEAYLTYETDRNTTPTVLAIAESISESDNHPVAPATSFIDLTNENEIRMAATVSGLDIMNGDDGNLWNGDKMVTRAEMAFYLCKLKGIDDLGSSMIETEFSDVNSTHWASGYIKTACDLGIAEGYKDGTYRPDDNIKYEDAVMMLVCALGYKPYALEQAPYPTGYLYAAITIGLTKGVDGTIGQGVSKAMLTTLIYNSIDIPLMQKINVGNSTSPYYGIFDGEDYAPKKTFLSETIGAVKISGTLTDNAISSESLEGNQVEISIYDNYGTRAVYKNSEYLEGNTITVYVGNTAANELLGRRVEAYLTFETIRANNPTILAIFETTKESSKLKIKFDDIISMENSGTAYSLNYWTDKSNNKSATTYVKSSATYYINSENCPAFTTRDLKEFVDDGAFAFTDVYAEIEFLLMGKSTGDYDYDTAFIDVYEDFIVDSIDETEGKIYADENSPSRLYSIDYSGDSYYFDLVDENGNDVNPADVKKQDTLTLKVTPYNYYTQNDISAISGKKASKSSLAYYSPDFTDKDGAEIKSFGSYEIVNCNIKVKNYVVGETPQTACIYAVAYGTNNTLISMKQLDASPIPASAEVTLSATFTSAELTNAQTIKIIALESGASLNNLLASAASISR